jgi:hypothetical protein
MNSPQADGHSPVRFPHSEISGSQPVSGSPELIAAVHVLHRLWLPRHPPYALCSLTLSLRHASSRARDSTRESRSVAHPSSYNCYPLDDTIYSRRLKQRLFRRYSVVKEPGQASLPRPATRRAPHRGLIFVELIGIEPTTSGLQSQRSPN